MASDSSSIGSGSIKISNVFASLFREMNFHVQIHQSIVCLFRGTVRIAADYGARAEDVDTIFSYVPYCPECASDCEILWKFASAGGITCLRGRLVKLGKFSDLLRLSRWSNIPLTAKEFLQVGPYVVVMNDKTEVDSFEQHVKFHPDLSDFEKYRYLKPLRDAYSKVPRIA